jgi:hypothetical protein
MKEVPGSQIRRGNSSCPASRSIYDVPGTPRTSQKTHKSAVSHKKRGKTAPVGL